MKYLPFTFSVLFTSPQSGKWPLIPSAQTPRDDVARLSRAMILSLSTLFLSAVSVFAESYPNRPTAAEMDGIVTLGTECMLGVNERCYATQYQTNPVAYYVDPPFTNTTGYYLDHDLMATMASTIRSLVPYYVDTNTVYNGTANIVMLTVTGLWASLSIGDHTNQFICTPAFGTNAATYGDDPWRIYVTNLQERYKVLNALKIPQPNYPAITPAFANITKYGGGYAEGHWCANGWPDYNCKDGGGTITAVAESRADDAYDASTFTTNNSVYPIATSRNGGMFGGHKDDNGHWCPICTANLNGGASNWADAYAWLGENLFIYQSWDVYLSRGARRSTYQINLVNYGYVSDFIPSLTIETVTAIPVSYGVYASQGDFLIQGTNIVENILLNSAITNITVDIGNYSLPRPTWEGTWGGGYGVSAINSKIVYTCNATVNTNFSYCTN